MTAVECRQITKTYGEGPSAVQALRGIDLDVNEGELLMIVGPSGSGKTTLISIIAGILHHDEGECLILGEDIKNLTNGDRTKFRGENIGFVFQSFNLIPMLTAAENVSIPLVLNGMKRNEAEEKAAEFLKSIGLSDKVDKFPRELSGGQQQRIAIARGCIHDPRIIVCDEPTSALDAETGQLVMDVLRKNVLESDRALIVVTHDSRIFEYADRIVKVEDGSVRQEPANGKKKTPEENTPQQ